MTGHVIGHVTDHVTGIPQYPVVVHYSTIIMLQREETKFLGLYPPVSKWESLMFLCIGYRNRIHTWPLGM